LEIWTISVLNMIDQVPVFSQPQLAPSIAIVLKQETPEPAKPALYTIKAGDTLTSIAATNKTTVSRLWSKNTVLAHPDTIKPDEQLTIPPADEQLVERPLPTPPPLPPAAPGPERASQPAAVLGLVAGNTYYWGQCVWHVKNLRPEIPNTWGNATDWLANARRDGWATGSEPVVGAVAWARTYGHVALVRAVYDNGTLLVEEMNYVGVGRMSTRVAPNSEWLFIY
jgi:LysM repeat protein